MSRKKKLHSTHYRPNHTVTHLLHPRFSVTVFVPRGVKGFLSEKGVLGNNARTYLFDVVVEATSRQKILLDGVSADNLHVQFIRREGCDCPESCLHCYADYHGRCKSPLCRIKK